jgi:hypothetical protein
MYTQSFINGRTNDGSAQGANQLSEIQQGIWALRDAVERMSRDLQMLLDERTKPMQFEATPLVAKKLLTEETVETEIDNASVKEFAEQIKKRTAAHAVIRFERRINQYLGGGDAFKKKLASGIARILHEYDDTKTRKGYAIGKIRIFDTMQMGPNGEFHSGSRTVDYHSDAEFNDLCKHIQSKYSYNVRRDHA